LELKEEVVGVSFGFRFQLGVCWWLVLSPDLATGRLEIPIRWGFSSIIFTHCLRASMHVQLVQLICLFSVPSWLLGVCLCVEGMSALS